MMPATLTWDEYQEEVALENRIDQQVDSFLRKVLPVDDDLCFRLAAGSDQATERKVEKTRATNPDYYPWCSSTFRRLEFALSGGGSVDGWRNPDDPRVTGAELISWTDLNRNKLESAAKIETLLDATDDHAMISLLLATQIEFSIKALLADPADPNFQTALERLPARRHRELLLNSLRRGLPITLGLLATLVHEFETALVNSNGFVHEYLKSRFHDIPRAFIGHQLSKCLHNVIRWRNRLAHGDQCDWTRTDHQQICEQALRQQSIHQWLDNPSIDSPFGNLLAERGRRLFALELVDQLDLPLPQSHPFEQFFVEDKYMVIIPFRPAVKVLDWPWPRDLRIEEAPLIVEWITLCKSASKSGTVSRLVEFIPTIAAFGESIRYEDGSGHSYEAVPKWVAKFLFGSIPVEDPIAMRVATQIAAVKGRWAKASHLVLLLLKYDNEARGSERPRTIRVLAKCLAELAKNSQSGQKSGSEAHLAFQAILGVSINELARQSGIERYRIVLWRDSVVEVLERTHRQVRAEPIEIQCTAMLQCFTEALDYITPTT